MMCWGACLHRVQPGLLFLSGWSEGRTACWIGPLPDSKPQFKHIGGGSDLEEIKTILQQRAEELHNLKVRATSEAEYRHVCAVLPDITCLRVNICISLHASLIIQGSIEALGQGQLCRC